jgi:hypothetical protein
LRRHPVAHRYCRSLADLQTINSLHSRRSTFDSKQSPVCPTADRHFPAGNLRGLSTIGGVDTVLVRIRSIRCTAMALHFFSGSIRQPKSPAADAGCTTGDTRIRRIGLRATGRFSDSRATTGRCRHPAMAASRRSLGRNGCAARKNVECLLTRLPHRRELEPTRDRSA